MQPNIKFQREGGATKKVGFFLFQFSSFYKKKPLVLYEWELVSTYHSFLGCSAVRLLTNPTGTWQYEVSCFWLDLRVGGDGER